MPDFPEPIWDGQDRGVTIKRAAEILGYSRWTIARMLEKGELQAFGEGKKTRIPLSSILQYWSSSRAERDGHKATQKEIKRVSKRHSKAMSKLEELLK